MTFKGRQHVARNEGTQNGDHALLVETSNTWIALRGRDLR